MAANALMQRPQSHITDDLGEGQMRAVFAPLGWAVNKIVSDYGIDFDVQIFKDQRATGEWFKIQLKSSETTKYSASQDFISEQLTRKHITHYCDEMREPVLLIHADIKNRRTFWLALQLQPPARQARANRVTVRIPVSNELPLTLPEMAAALANIQLRLGAKAVAETPVSTFAEAVKNHPKQDELIEQLQDRVDALKLSRAHNDFRAHNYAAAKRALHTIIDNPSASVWSKFSAILEEELVLWSESHQDAGPQSESAKIRLRIAKRLQGITQDGPPALKLFALLARKSAELEILTFRDLGLSMNFLGHVWEGNPLIAINLQIDRAESSRLIARKYNQCLRLSRLGVNSAYRWALPRALLRVCEGIMSFIIRLSYEHESAAATAYVTSALSVCRVAGYIAVQEGDDGIISSASATAILFYHYGPKEAEDLAQELARHIRNPEQKRVTEELLQRAKERSRGVKFEGDVPTTRKQIFENRAAALGIDMNNSADAQTRLVQLGIQDLNPSRALTHCEHTFVSLGRPSTPLGGQLAEWLQLPTINTKTIHCDLHNYAVQAPTLDSAIELFKSRHCDKCPDRSPRPDSWQYSDEWQQSENRRHLGFMKTFRASGPRH